MTWRIVSISSVAKLDLRINYLVVRGEELRRIHLSEVSILLIENTAVSLTAALLCELNKRKIKVIFCDEKRNPYGEITSFYGSHDSTEKLRSQIKWSEESKGTVWAEIVREKIAQQRNLLIKFGHLSEAEMLSGYMSEIKFADTTNREGHAAKVYFNSLFGKEFSRGLDSPINACLNYGYAIMLSAINREISAFGYFTQLGIFHDNTFNPYNLGSDLIEPLRPLIDETVINMMPNELNPENKKIILNILNREVIIDNKRNYVNNAIRLYCKSVLDAISENDIGLLRFCTYET